MTPTTAPAPATPSGTHAPAAPDFSHNALVSTVMHIWPLLLVVAAWIGVLYAWKRLRQYNAQRGKATPPLGQVVRPLLRFAFREDKRPVFNRPKAVAARLAWLTGNRFYLILLVLIPLSEVTGLLPWPAVLALLVLVLWARYAPIARARRSVLMQMFAVASAECRYPRGSELNPWGYVSITKWNNLVQPGETVVTYPAAYQSEDQRTREKFERQFNGTISDENTWNYKWESSKNRVTCRPTDFLPTMAPYPGPGPKWNEFNLGVGAEGPVTWDCAVAPHILVCGPTGSGKSVLQRMILFHALVHSDTWRIVGVDPKMVEMGWLSKYPNVLKIALDLEEGVEIVQTVRDEMKRRFEEMTENGVNHFQKLPNPPPALMLMVDETYNFLAPEGIRSDEGKERDDLHARGSVLIGEIARLGRAAGVHLVLATQRPDATVLKGELKNNLDARVAAGRMDTTPSLMVLDDEAATRLPKVKGRGLLRIGGEMSEFQGYFAEQEWVDEFFAQQETTALPPAAAAEAAVGPDAPEAGGKPRGGLLGRVKAAAAERTEQMRAEVAAQATPTPVEAAEPALAPDAAPDSVDPVAENEPEPIEEPDEDGWDEEEIAAAAAEVIAPAPLPPPAAAPPAPPAVPGGGLPVARPGLPSARPPAPGGLPVARPPAAGGLPVAPPQGTPQSGRPPVPPAPSGTLPPGVLPNPLGRRAARPGPPPPAPLDQEEPPVEDSR